MFLIEKSCKRKVVSYGLDSLKIHFSHTKSLLLRVNQRHLKNDLTHSECIISCPLVHQYNGGGGWKPMQTMDQNMIIKKASKRLQLSEKQDVLSWSYGTQNLISKS